MIKIVVTLLLSTGILNSIAVSGPVQWKIADGGNDHWYEVFAVPDSINWTDAKAAAEAIGSDSHLATITSAEENEFIFSLVSGQSQYWFCCTGGNANGPWLGAERASTSGSFGWITGEDFVYTNWAPSEPFGNGDNIALFGPGNTQTSAWNDIGPNRPDVISYVVESVAPVPAPDCIAIYNTDGSLNIPCISVSDVFGGTNMYQADMKLIPFSTPFSFELTKSQQIDVIPINTNNCVAPYKPDGVLTIPCVSVTDAFGGTVMYEADIELSTSLKPIIFTLIKATKK